MVSRPLGRGSYAQAAQRSGATARVRSLAWLVFGIVALAALSACAREWAPRAEQVAGGWEKEEDTLPPIHLLLWLERDTLRARLRLSGSESAGTATVDGTELRLRLAGRPDVLVGEFLSETELRFELGTKAYRLRRKS